jgi:hypothetical protein
MAVLVKFRLQVDTEQFLVTMCILVDFLCFLYSTVFCNIIIDSAYIVQGDGGTPKISTDTASNYSKTYHFKHLTSYPLSQWTDV